MNKEYTYTPVDFDPFADGELEKIIPAIESQQEIWLACMIGGADANRSYNESISLQLQGPLRRSALEKALLGIVARHESLRAVFSADGKNLCIRNTPSFDFQFQDLTQLDTFQQEQALNAFAGQDMLTAFDLQNGPLFRAALFRIAPDQHHLRLTAHHIVCDGWSLGILLEDLGVLYSADVKGGSPILEPAVNFSTYAAEMLAYSGSAEYRKTEEYWLQQFKGDAPELTVPTDRPRPALRTYKSRRDDFIVDPSLLEAVKRTGARTGSSLVTTLMVAFEVYLHHITGQGDIVLGLPTAGQSATGHLNLVGHCVNLLPLRSRPDGDLPFIDYLRLRRKQILDDYDHQQITFGTLLKRLNIRRDASRIPLVPVVLNIDAGMDSRVNFHQLSHRLIYNPREFENFEIFINATGTQQSMTLEWSYNTALFNPETIRNRMAAFENVLRCIVSNPSTPIRDLPARSPDEIRLLAEWNATEANYLRDKTTAQLIHESSLGFPDNIAIRCGDESLSYRQLDQQVSQLAAYLQQQGIQKGDIVALAADRSAVMVVALLAILRAGAGYLPLDPQFPRDRIEFMLDDSKASLLLTSGAYKDHFGTHAKQLVLEEIMPLIANLPGSFSGPALSGNDLAYVLYTSGSTGKPKGVQVEHHNLVNFLLSMQKTPGITAGDRLLAVTTISFDIAGLELYLPLIAGAQLILADKDTVKDGRLLAHLLDDSRATIMQATPSGWRILLDADPKRRNLKALCGGEALPKDLADALLASTQSLWNVYGPTETTIWSSVKQITPADTLITIGRPIDNTQIYILDPYGHPTPIGTPGEIVIAGDGVARGYLGRPELTAEKFIPDTFATRTGLRMYRTGDLGKLLPNGEILCLGRMDQQVKIRGYRIEPGEIEFALTRIPGIREAVVITREDNPGDHRLVAYLVAPGNTERGFADWRKALKASLPEYMIPTDFVLVDSLPKTNNGKIDRKSLPKPAQISNPAGEFIAPSTDAEKLVARIWSEALGIEKPSIDANFFELGGYSLIAVKVMVAIERETGRRLPLATLFENPTIEKLALMVTVDEAQISWDSLVPIKSSGSKPPIYLVHGHGLNVLAFSAMGKYMDEDQPVYALQALGLGGKAQLLYTIEEIAAKYNSEILEKNPDGQFALAGYSLGGLIAYEMAKQLIAMGKQVIMLGILDTYAGNRDITETKMVHIYKKVIRQFRKLAFFSRSFFRSPKTIIKYQSMILGGKVRNLFTRGYKVGKEFFTYEEEINRSYDMAYDNYFMDPMDIEVDLFRVEKRVNYIDDPVYLEWDKFAKKGVSVHVVPGDHKTFLFPPNDKVCARTLQDCLNARQIDKGLRPAETIHKPSVLRAV